MVIFNRSVALKVSILIDNVKMYCCKVSSRDILFKEGGSVERRHTYFVDMLRSWFSTSSKAMETLIFLVLSCRDLQRVPVITLLKLTIALDAIPSVVNPMIIFFHALYAINKRGHARKWKSSMLMAAMEAHT